MEFDVWRQWQSMAAMGAAAGSPFSSAPQPGLAPFIDAAERFAGAARAFAEVSGDSSAPGGTAAAAAVFSNFLRDQFAGTFKPPWAGQLGAGGTFAPAFGTDAPALGLTREHQERMQRAADAGRRMAEAQQRLTRLWSDTLREAAAAYSERLTMPAATQNPEELNRLYDAWIDCAEEAYARTAHSDAFCDALADYVNAGSDWRRESSAGVEHWAKLLDLPTRNELNTLAQRLRGVEEELRSLREAARPRTPRARRKAKP